MSYVSKFQADFGIHSIVVSKALKTSNSFSVMFVFSG